MKHESEQGDPVGAASTPAPTYDALKIALEQLREEYQRAGNEAYHAGRFNGTGGCWELSGYADILTAALERMRRGRQRVENFDARYGIKA